MITIIDYGLGNVLAFVNVFKRLNIQVSVAKTAAELKGVEKIILPGVGAFDHAMELLDQSGMRETLDEIATSNRTPILGVCVGMQILGHSSEEGKLPGLGWIDGRVKRLAFIGGQNKLPLPHMGWNDVSPLSGDKLFDHLEADSQFYFLHSYYLQCDRDNDVIATTCYGGEFSSAVKSRNIYGVQFHPEKSHHYGTRLLKNFAELQYAQA